MIEEQRDIENLQIDLYKRIGSFLEKCNDPAVFDLGSIPLYKVMQDFHKLSEIVKVYNLKSQFAKTEKIEDAFNILCEKIAEPPDLKLCNTPQ